MANYQGLVDHLGRPIEKSFLTAEVAGPTLSGVRSPRSDYPADGLTPPRLTEILREADQGIPRRFYELAETIEERDMHYAGVLAVRKRSVAQIEITVEAAGEDAASVEQAEMVEDWLNRDELQDELFNVLDAIGKGESFTEIMWDSSSGQWMPERLCWRDPRWFRPDRLDLTTPMLIDEAGMPQPLPGYKFLHLVARGKSGLPARSGIGRLATWFWLFKAMTVRDWAIYRATFGIPMRVGKYGPNASEEDKDTLLRAVSNIAGDCAAIIPASMLIEFVQQPAGSSAGDLYKDGADWLDQQMSKAVLGQTTTTDAVSGGHAVSKEHRQVQEDIERADARVLSAALNRDLVRPWIDLEYGPQKKYPRVRIARPESEDLQQLSTSLAALVPLGLKVSAKEVRGKFGLSDPQPDEEVLEQAPPPPVVIQAAPGVEGQQPPRPGLPAPKGTLPPGPPPPPPGLPAPRPTLHAADDRSGEAEADREQAAIDALSDETGTLAAPAMNAIFDFIGELVRDSGSLEEVRTKLLAAAPSISSAGLTTALMQAQVVARLSGRGTLADA